MRLLNTSSALAASMVRLASCMLVAIGLFMPVGAAAAAERVICCGEEEVFVLEIDRDVAKEPEVVWSWTAEDSLEIPEEGKRSFASTDECKPYGEFILVTSSSGGVALVRRSDKRCHFYTQAKNAHSACLLPRYRVAVASSFGGDELLVYEIATPDGIPAKPITSIPLRGAHGAIWDEKLNRLWALGSDELLLVEIVEDQNGCNLRIEKRIALPTAGGHDLARSSEQDVLFVSTNKHVYLFNKRDGQFVPAPGLSDEPKVKSVSVHPQTGEVVFHQGTPENWWSDRIQFLGQRDEITLPGRRLYKIRWDQQANP